jgi:hypothetical protein
VPDDLKLLCLLSMWSVLSMWLRDKTVENNIIDYYYVYFIEILK